MHPTINSELARLRHIDLVSQAERPHRRPRRHGFWRSDHGGRAARRAA